MEYIWKTQNGTNIKVKDMTTKHILNTLKCIEDGRIRFTINLGWFEDNDFQIIDENDIAKERWIKIFNDELERRNEYAKKRVYI